jgi:hypothetical protein
MSGPVNGFGQSEIQVLQSEPAIDIACFTLLNLSTMRCGTKYGAALLLLWWSNLCVADANPKPLMVHYMPWFVAKPYSDSWGWHWTMNHFNPDLTNTNGERQIASWYYPQIGPYDSLDPAVLEYHVLLMKLAGIDGVIVDWYGTDNFRDYAVNNQRTLALFRYTRKAGLKFALCYEDATVRNEVNASPPFISATDAIAHAQQTMLYVQTNYFDDGSYLRWNQKPVLLNFGPQYFTNSTDWSSIFSVLNASNQPAFFTEDDRLAAGTGAFDWPPMWMSRTNNGVLTEAMLQSYLARFEQKTLGSPAWPAFISSAFPRFHDIYQQAGVGPSYGYLDGQEGNTFRETLMRAMTNRSALVQIVTWNDFGEGTMVEPTVEYGYRDLGLIQELRRQYLDPNFPYHTNDLTLARRFYQLRQAYNGHAIVSAELDRIFQLIVAGNLTDANARLTGIESSVPVIYGLSLTNDELQFHVGGYLSGSGIQVESSTNLLLWNRLDTLAVSTNQLMVDTLLQSERTPIFFRIRNLGP